MHRRCSTDRLLSALLLLLSLLLNGCGTASSAETEGITLSGWIILLCDQAGIHDYEQKEPYFTGAGKEEECFAAVQSAVEWGVLSTDIPFDPDAALTREWTAYTLANLCSLPENSTMQIEDIEETQFPLEVQAAVSSGLMSLQGLSFQPDQVLSAEEAQEYLANALERINDRTFTNESSIQWNADAHVREIQPLTFEEESMTACYPSSAEIQDGDYVAWTDVAGSLHVCQVLSAREEENSITAILENVEDVTDLGEIHIQGSMEADFSKASITAGDGTEVQEESALNGPSLLSSSSIIQKTFAMNGYSIQIRATTSSVTAEAYRTLDSGAKIYADLKLSNVKASYQFAESSDEDNSYFKVSFKTTESAGVKNSSYRNLYGDFSGFNADQFVSSFLSMWKQKKDAEDTVLTICTIELPVPGQPALTLALSLELHIYANGKAEITLTQNNVLGAETKNGKVRLIRSTEYSKSAVIKATTGLTAGIRFALNLLKKTVADLSVNSGVKAVVSTKFNLYDEEGNVTSQSSEADAGAAEELAETNPDVLICTDTRAYWILNVKVNGSSSILGKLGLGRKFDILNEENAPLFSALNCHFENGLKVDKCTRNSRKVLPSAEALTIAETLRIADYSLVVHPDTSAVIEVTAVPSGYTKTSLTYSSSDDDIVSVDASGRIYFESTGTATVIVSTADGKYTVSCSVLAVKDS